MSIHICQMSSDVFLHMSYVSATVHTYCKYKKMQRHVSYKHHLGPVSVLQAPF